MSTALLAALAGALVGFLGTYLIQRGQWRRDELEFIRMRLGVIRALTIDLGAAALSVDTSEKNAVIVSGTRYPTTTWFAHGHLVLGILNLGALEPLMEAFGRFDLLNGMLAGSDHIEIDEEVAESFNLPLLKSRIAAAIETLERLEAEAFAKGGKAFTTHGRPA